MSESSTEQSGGHLALPALKWGEDGLIPVVVQDVLTGELRMFAWANPEALRMTLQTRFAYFFSRSRQSLWKKGETSGNVLHVHEVWTDCDRDSVVYMVRSEGPSCHTGAESCFFEALEGAAPLSPSLRTSSSVPPARSSPSLARALPALARLDETIATRATSHADKSYTKSLLDGGLAKITSKIVEESEELCAALERESEERVVSEAADVLFHLMVGLHARGKRLRDVQGLLMKRFGVSGLDEKKARSGQA
jgi:phosphoribosyl-ATP pyrophosphohydrolase/phosphoribosyl-AMP cyclohydrolase